MISKNIQDNRLRLIEIFNNSSDMVIHEMTTLCNTQVLVSYIDGLIDKESLKQNVLKPLVENLVSPLDVSETIFVSEKREVYKYDDIVKGILNANVALFHEGFDKVFLIDLSKYEKRKVNISEIEQTLRGPKQAFIEDIHVNKVLIRRIIKNNNLVFEDFRFGEETSTKVSIVYIKGIVNEEILNELRSRLLKIKVDGVLDSNYIGEYIDDEPKGVVPTIYNTEKPDIVAGKILEGRIAILCDGSPDALTVPMVFIETLMNAEDYYLKPLYATYLRTLRLISLFISIALVGLYVAISNFHQEMIPTPLLISIAGQREGVPLTSLVEALFMVLFFEIIKEAGQRLPRTIGQTVTMIGGLVIGQAAVEAGVVSSIMVIVVSATGIAEFVNPPLREFVAINRLILMLLGALAGIYGIVCGIIINITYLASIKCFGVPYLYPLSPYDKEGMKDVLIRAPIKKFNYRPDFISNKDSRKRGRKSES